MKDFKTTLIIATYNWPQALDLVLKSVLIQTVMPDEVIIADDGSKTETRQLIESYQKTFPIPLIHVWHEDIGFRLSEIRNKAIAKAKYDYIVQIDGDIILHNEFIKDHNAFAQPKTFVRASRSYISKNKAGDILKKKKYKLSYFSSGITNRLSAVHFPAAWKLFEYTYKAKEIYEIHGCNMAFWKDDVLSINGYNENFTGWGLEDKEFVVRMLNRGYKKRFIKLGAICFHIWHPENTKPNLKNNEIEFLNSINENKDFCKNGIDKHFQK